MYYEHSTWWCDCGAEMVVDPRNSTQHEVVLKCNKRGTPCDHIEVFTSNRNLGLGPDGRVFPSGHALSTLLPKKEN